MLIGEEESVATVAKTTLYNPIWVYELVKKFCTCKFDEYVKETRNGKNNTNLAEKQEAEIINSKRNQKQGE